MVDTENPKRTRRDFLTGVAAATVGALPAFTPYSKPVRDEEGQVSPGFRDNFIIDAALMNLITAEFAKELKAEGDFVNKDGEHFVQFTDDRAVAVIALPDGTKRAFSRIDSLTQIDDNTGAKVIAFREMNLEKAATILKGDPSTVAESDYKPDTKLRVCFPGHSDSEDKLGEADTESAKAVIRGFPSGAEMQGYVTPQAAFIQQYTKESLLTYLNANPGLELQMFAHSLGAPNAVHAKYELESRNIHPTVTLFEPLGATQEATAILNKQHQMKFGRLADQDIARMTHNVTTIRSDPPTFVAQIEPGQNTTVGNKPLGDHYVTIDWTADGNFRHPYLVGTSVGAAAGIVTSGAITLVPYVSGVIKAALGNTTQQADKQTGDGRTNRRTWFGQATGLGAAAATGAIFSTLGTMVDQAVFNDAAHDTGLITSLFHAGSDRLLTPCNRDQLASREHILNPTIFGRLSPDSRQFRSRAAEMGL